MSNYHGAVGSERTKNYEIIRSHQAFTFGTVLLDHTVLDCEKWILAAVFSLRTQGRTVAETTPLA